MLGSRSAYKRRHKQHFLAVHAVWFEPVSGPASLINRENTGNFVAFGPNLSPMGRNRRAIQRGYSQIPYEMEQGN